MSRRFLDLTAEVGLPRIALHGPRHTHATRALAAGVDVAIVYEQDGDRVTLDYTFDEAVSGLSR